MTKKAIVYVHGKGGSAAEAEYYRPFFPACEVIGFEYKSQTPWEAMAEFSDFFDDINRKYASVDLIANSIGAYFAMNALNNRQIEKAFFVSPIVNMEQLIFDMMQWTGVTEKDLEEQGTIATDFGETLSWEYLLWIRNHPISWQIPTSILCGSADHLQSMDTVRKFAESIGADVTVMEHGEHWFHTEEQMSFLGSWISEKSRIL